MNLVLNYTFKDILVFWYKEAFARLHFEKHKEEALNRSKCHTDTYFSQLGTDLMIYTLYESE